MFGWCVCVRWILFLQICGGGSCLLLSFNSTPNSTLDSTRGHWRLCVATPRPLRLLLLQNSTPDSKRQRGCGTREMGYRLVLKTMDAEVVVGYQLLFHPTLN